MANTPDTPNKAKKNNASPNALKKIGLSLKRMPFAIFNSFKNMVAELKKVSWPTKLELRNYSMVVLIFMVFMGIVIYLIDSGSALVSNWIISG